MGWGREGDRQKMPILPAIMSNLQCLPKAACCNLWGRPKTVEMSQMLPLQTAKHDHHWLRVVTDELVKPLPFIL